MVTAPESLQSASPWLEIALGILGGYLLIGVCFGLLFALGNGSSRIDPAAAHATLGFRFIVLPGVAIFWPYLLFRWLRATPPPEESSSHRRASRPS